MKWIKDLFSINESKKSSIVISFFVILACALYKLITTDDIPDNTATVIIWFASIIGGVNALPFATNAIASLKNMKQQTDKTNVEIGETNTDNNSPV